MATDKQSTQAALDAYFAALDVKAAALAAKADAEAALSSAKASHDTAWENLQAARADAAEKKAAVVTALEKLGDDDPST